MLFAVIPACDKSVATKSFEVPQKTELIWNHLIDPTKIMDCVPGVSIDEKVGENHYKGKVGMKFGPMGVKYDADIFYNEIDIENLLSLETNFLKSISDARRSLKENSISVNKNKIKETYKISKSDLINNKYVLLQRGRKNYHLVIFN